MSRIVWPPLQSSPNKDDARPLSQCSFDLKAVSVRGAGPTQKEPRARDAGPRKETVVLPWWGNHNDSEIPKQGNSRAHKQKPRPHTPEGRGFRVKAPASSAQKIGEAACQPGLPGCIQCVEGTTPTSRWYYNVAVYSVS